MGGFEQHVASIQRRNETCEVARCEHIEACSPRDGRGRGCVGRAETLGKMQQHRQTAPQHACLSGTPTGTPHAGTGAPP